MKRSLAITIICLFTLPSLAAQRVLFGVTLGNDGTKIVKVVEHMFGEAIREVRFDDINLSHLAYAVVADDGAPTIRVNSGIQPTQQQLGSGRKLKVNAWSERLVLDLA